MTNININTRPYNNRRYSKPWIAIVDFRANPKGDFKFGDWIGDHREGSEGILMINANEGDIVAVGQKDFRQPRNSAPTYHQIVDGALVELSGKAEAYKVAIK